MKSVALQFISIETHTRKFTTKFFPPVAVECAFRNNSEAIYVVFSDIPPSPPSKELTILNVYLVVTGYCRRFNDSVTCNDFYFNTIFSGVLSVLHCYRSTVQEFHLKKNHCRTNIGMTKRFFRFFVFFD